MNAEEFYEKIDDLPQDHENRDLEEYLLALYRNVQKYKEEKLTYDLVFKMISEAFTSEAAIFDNGWLSYETPPDVNRMSRKFTNPEISNAIDKTNRSQLEAFEFTEAVLRFQIAELHKMRGKQLSDEFRYFGIDSETGNRWYNFDPFGNLECGARCMVDGEDSFDTLEWSFIGELLENGRIYE